MNNRKRIRKEDLQKALIILSVIFFLIAAGGFLISRWENAKYATGGGEGTVEADTVMREARTYTYQGQDYKENKKVRSYLIIGCDTTGEAISRTNGGQADAQVLIVVDDLNQTWRLLQLDRDTIVNFDTFNPEGKLIGDVDGQLTLAHSFGTWENGAKNTANAVSRLLWDQKIDGYFSMNMDAIPTLNDAVGGVPVKVTTDFTEVDDTLTLGEEITLTGEQAERFVRTRKTVDDGTNEARMARQETYMKSLIKKLSSLSSDEILDIYDRLMANSVTNMGSGDFVDLADMTKEYTQLDNVRFEGTHQMNGNFMEFLIDEDSRTQVILELFYTKE